MPAALKRWFWATARERQWTGFAALSDRPEVRTKKIASAAALVAFEPLATG